jgi:hypothetical protein
MVRCSHVNCWREQRIWIPESITFSDSIKSISSTGLSDVSLHYWCIHCGCIQNKTDDRPKKLGYWINIFSKMEREYYFTQAQKRLIIKELESNEDFIDLYRTTGTAQRKIFAHIVKKYCHFDQSKINSYIF